MLCNHFEILNVSFEGAHGPRARTFGVSTKLCVLKKREPMRQERRSHLPSSRTARTENQNGSCQCRELERAADDADSPCGLEPMTATTVRPDRVYETVAGDNTHPSFRGRSGNKYASILCVKPKGREYERTRATLRRGIDDSADTTDADSLVSRRPTSSQPGSSG